MAKKPRDPLKESVPIHEQIEDARLAAGLSRAQLAGAVGTGESAIYRLENPPLEEEGPKGGKKRGPTSDLLRRIATATGRPIVIWPDTSQ